MPRAGNTFSYSFLRKTFFINYSSACPFNQGLIKHVSETGASVGVWVGKQELGMNPGFSHAQGGLLLYQQYGPHIYCRTTDSQLALVKAKGTCAHI